MKTLFVASILIASVSFGSSAMAAMSQADCEATWKKADVNSDGKMDGMEAKPYIDAMTVANLKPMDTKGEALQADEFLKSCQAGTFDSVKT